MLVVVICQREDANTMFWILNAIEDHDIKYSMIFKPNNIIGENAPKIKKAADHFYKEILHSDFPADTLINNNYFKCEIKEKTMNEVVFCNKYTQNHYGIKESGCLRTNIYLFHRPLDLYVNSQ